MTVRSSFFAYVAVAALLSAILRAGESPSAAEDVCGSVSLTVSAASVERGDIDTLFRFEAALENTTGKDLEVRTTFSGVFDGLSLDVKTTKGKALVEQSYTHHQSPFAPPGRVFTLKQGKTTATLVFPVRDFPADASELEVSLHGGLPGYGEQYKLVTKPIRLKIE